MMQKGLHDDIFKAAYSCQLAFEAITASIDDERVLTRIPLLFVQTLQHSNRPITTLSDIGDDFEQFRVWAKNLGVFAYGNASLDYRLRESAEIYEGFVSLLNSLSNELRNCQELLMEDRAIPEEIMCDDSADSSDSNDSLQPDPPRISATERTAKELQIRFQHIGDIIDKLIRLAELIRAPGSANRTSKAVMYTHYEDGINVTDLFEGHYLPLLLKHRFNLQELLLDRFVKMISTRRRIFLYQAKHQKKLAYGGCFPETTQPKSDISRTEWKSMPTRLTPQKLPSADQLMKMAIPSLVTIPTQATTFQMPMSKPNTPSRILSASSKNGMNLIDIPAPPHIEDRATHFQCPYCCILVPRSKLSPSQWRKHVIADLRPYVCIEPDCTTPDSELNTFEDFINHQGWEHAMEWWCDGYNATHRVERFQTRTAYANHLRTFHNLVDAQLIERQIQTSGRPSLELFTCCPFCPFEPLINPTAQPEPVSRAIHSQKELQKHIADELLKIFLVALPERDDIIDSRTDSNAPQGSRSTLKSLADISTTFEHLDLNQTVAGNADTKSKTVSNLDKEMPVPLCNPELCKTIWDNVWESPELDGSVRKMYTGPENDEILQDFLVGPFSNVLPSQEKFSMGWIAKTDLDYTVAQELFSERFQVPPELEHQWPKHRYTCGRMNHHNVVLERPDSELRMRLNFLDRPHHLLKFFPELQLILMVGNSIGVSNIQNDVRLGDVVVGYTENNTQRMPCLAREETAWTKLIGHGISLPAGIHKTLSELKKKKQRVSMNNLTINAKLQNLERADNNFREYFPNYVMPRFMICRNDGPMVHYGSIGFIRNSSIIDANSTHLERARRNQWILANMEDVLSLETIADAAPTNCPLLFIYGLHKHMPKVHTEEPRSTSILTQVRQKFAIATAAVYAKDLLMALPPSVHNV